MSNSFFDDPFLLTATRDTVYPVESFQSAFCRDELYSLSELSSSCTVGSSSAFKANHDHNTLSDSTTSYKFDSELWRMEWYRGPDIEGLTGSFDTSRTKVEGGHDFQDAFNLATPSSSHSTKKHSHAVPTIGVINSPYFYPAQTSSDHFTSASPLDEDLIQLLTNPASPSFLAPVLSPLPGSPISPPSPKPTLAATRRVAKSHALSSKVPHLRLTTGTVRRATAPRQRNLANIKHGNSRAQPQPEFSLDLLVIHLGWTQERSSSGGLTVRCLKAGCKKKGGEWNWKTSKTWSSYVRSAWVHLMKHHGVPTFLIGFIDNEGYPVEGADLSLIQWPLIPTLS